MSADLTYVTVRDALKLEIPELRDPIARLEADWADDPTGLGEYIVFEEVLGAYLEVLMALSTSPVRDRLLARSFAFLERLTCAADMHVVNLGVVALCERIECLAGWQPIADRFAGAATWRHLNRDVAGSGNNEIIDLWGVREVLAEQGFELSSLPGVTHPADHRRLAGLDDALRHPEGVVILSSYGKSNPMAVVRAVVVQASAGALDALAQALARDLGGIEPLGVPCADYFSIPAGECVWRMHRGDEEHGRLTTDLWLHPDLTRRARATAVSVLLGKPVSA